ncbi:hypothetical protein NE235_26460 [Actinoallomurus spadix]|uniref:Lipoprotein n=1 Tax=Actinoallomurus spadix TaxID=79912 RepID=A0ABN0WY60_9ACTN|nr:hypothetical protein [Actinoallomurus spadix]MCO5989657.1 hypothetical protein [Actinoallomurus spadix]
MRRIWPVVAVLVLGSCGVRPSGVTDAGRAPTGVAHGVTLYFVDAHERLRPQFRRTYRLGTVPEAVSLLLFGVGDSDLHTEIASVAGPRILATTGPGLIQLRVPLALREVTPLGIDQIVCTALGVHVQSGGSRRTRVQVRFTLSTHESEKRRTCPLIR